MSRPPLVLLASMAVAGALALTGQAASGSSPSSGTPARPADATRVLDLGGQDRVQLTPLGDTGRTAITPLPSREGSSGLYLTRTDSGTTLQSTDGGSPTLVEGHVDRSATERDASDLVELDFSAFGRDGREAPARVTVFDLATGAAYTRELPADPGSTCTTGGYEYSDCVLVPPGDYSVMAFVTTLPASQSTLEAGRTVQNVSLVGDPEVEVTGQRDFVFDARDARRVTVDTPDHETETDAQGTMQLSYRRTARNGAGIEATYFPSFTLDKHFYEEPTPEPVTVGSFQTLTRLRLVEPDITFEAPRTRTLTPEYYDPVWFSDVDSDFPMYDGRARLPVVDVGQARPQDLRGRDLHGAIAVAERSDDLSVAEQSNAAAGAGAGLVAIYNDGPGDNGDPNGFGVKLEVPTVRLTRAEGRALTQLPGSARVAVHGAPASPYLYDLVIKEDGRIPSELDYTYRTRDLATQVRQVHGQPGARSTYSESAYQFQPGNTFSQSSSYPFRKGPRERTEYRIPDPDTRWMFGMATPELAYNALFPEPPVFSMNLASPHFATYRRGERQVLPVATAPIVTAPNPGAPIERAGDRMRVVVDGFTDAHGSHALAFTDIDGSGLRTHLDVEVDGSTVAQTDFLPYEIVSLPSGDSKVGISFTVDNEQSWNRLSTHTETRWGFTSRTAPEGDPVAQPLLVPDYDVPVDLDNRLTSGVHDRGAFDLSIAHQAGSSDAPVGRVRLDASFDGGDTWSPADVTRSGSRWHVELPPGTGMASLRLHAADTDGSSIDQTIVNAFLVRRGAH